MRWKPKKYHELDDQEKVDIILEWVYDKRAPRQFKPAWTIEMQRIISTGGILTRNQKKSLDNVIWGWNILEKKKGKKNVKTSRR